MNSTPKLVVSPMLNKQWQKEGKSKLCIRVTLDGKRFEVSSNFYVDQKFWDSKLMCVKSTDANSSIINSFINKAKMELDKIYMRLIALDEGITLDQIKSKFLGVEIKKEITPKKITIIEAIVSPSSLYILIFPNNLSSNIIGMVQKK
jgi:hypothetical protein